MDKQIAPEEYIDNLSFYLDKFIDTIPAYFFWKNKDGTYVKYNDLLLKTFNLTREQVIGKTDFDLWPESAIVLRDNDLEVMRKDKVLKFREEIYSPYNKKKQCFISMKMPLKDLNDNIIGVIGNSIDITDYLHMQIELQQEKEINNLKEEFLRNMQHDLRTPFSGILGLASCLEQQEINPEKKQTLGYIKKSAQSLLNALEGIFEYMKIENWKEFDLTQDLSIRDLLRDISFMFAAAVKDKHLKFYAEYDKNIPIMLNGNKLSILRILANLVGNAVKFTETGHIALKVKFIRYIKKKAIIQFVVEDTGIGIPVDKYDLIFEKFVRLNTHSEGIYKGFGLGLSFVKQLVYKLMGDISLQSAVGNGSTFICTIPFSLPKTKKTKQEQVLSTADAQQ